MKKALIALVGLGSLASAEVRVIPVIDVSLLGGGTYFEDEWSSFSGYFSSTLASGVRLSRKFTLIPCYIGSYSGVKEVTELLGGGTLYYETWENLLFLKMISKLGNFRIKPKVAYKLELRKQTKDEEWYYGLFDNRRLGGGVEFEIRPKEIFLRSVSLGVTYNLIEFPNFRSLSSIAAEKYGSEYDVGAGTNTLDYNSVSGSLDVNVLLRKGILTSMNLFYSKKMFVDQNIVIEDGSYKNEKRVDDIMDFTIGYKHRLPIFTLADLSCKSIAGGYITIRNYTSTQNHYDADPNRLQFLPSYYNYVSFKISPYWKGLLGKEMEVSLSYSFERRNYSDRLIQDIEGNYLTEKMYLITHNLNYTFSYRLDKYLGRNFAVKLMLTYYSSSSNMEFEQTYVYNFWGLNYFIGISFKI